MLNYPYNTLVKTVSNSTPTTIESALPEINVSEYSYDIRALAAESQAINDVNTDMLLTIFAQKALSKDSSVVIILPPIVPGRIFNANVAKGRGYLNYTPAGIMYVAACIRDAGLENLSEHLKLIDLNNRILQHFISEESPTYEYWKSILDLETSTLVNPIFIISCMFSTTKENYNEISEYISDTHPKSLIIAGGVQATFDASSLIENRNADIVSMYEAESNIPHLIQLIESYLHDGNKLALKCPGNLKFLSKAGIVETGSAMRSEQLDLDINEYYDQLEIGKYYQAGTIGGGYANFLFESSGIDRPWANVLTKRGCRAACAFCTVRNFNGKGIRLRSVDRLRSELGKLYNDHGIRHIDWLDDDFLNDKDHTKEFLNLIIDEFPDLVWTASNGLIGTAIDDELMDLMVKSGMKAFSIGIESGNSEVVKDIRKPTTLLGLIRRKSIFQKYPEVMFMANFIIGFPSENFGQMLDTYLFSRKLECDWSKFFVCQPLKGTDLFQNFQNMGDSRTQDDSWEKSGPNPGRMAAEKGGLETAFSEFTAGWHIFSLDTKTTFSKLEHDEIWFTFNLVTNFLQNPCYRDKVATQKQIFFLKSMRRPYPSDASMAAALAHCYFLLGNEVDAIKMRAITARLIINSSYWQRRVHAFPQILTLAGISSFNISPELLSLLAIKIPSELVPPCHKIFVDKMISYYDKLNWSHANVDSNVSKEIKVGLGPAVWGYS